MDYIIIMVVYYFPNIESKTRIIIVVNSVINSWIIIGTANDEWWIMLIHCKKRLKVNNIKNNNYIHIGIKNEMIYFIYKVTHSKSVLTAA